MQWKGRHSLIVCVAIYVFILFAVAIYPFLYVLYLSFFKWNLGTANPTMIFAGLGNYVKLLSSDSLFWNPLSLTVQFVIGAVALELLFGMALALLFYREFRGSTAVRMAILTPVLMTPVAIGLFFTLMLDADYGIYNYFLGALGLPNAISWTGNPQTALLTCILVDTWQWTPFMFLVLLAGLLGIPKPLIEAAEIDGASTLRRIRYLILPMLKPVIAVAILIRTIDAYKTFDLIFMLMGGGGGPADVAKVLSIDIYIVGFKLWRMGEAASLSIIMLLIGMILFTFFMRFIRRR